MPEGFSKSLFGAEAYPVVNVSETDKKIAVDAELPGLEAKDVDVSLQNDALVITGEKKFEGEEKKDNYHRIERSYGKFTRAVPLPAKVNAKGIKARFEKGVLHVALPKAAVRPGAEDQDRKLAYNGYKLGGRRQCEEHPEKRSDPLAPVWPGAPRRGRRLPEARRRRRPRQRPKA